MDKARTYGQACPVAHAMDVLGERWAMLVLRELRLGPRRYSDLAAALPGIGPTVLAARLRELVRGGVVERRTLPPPASTRVYALTERGRALEPVFRELARWGAASPQPLEGVLSADAVLLGLRTFFRAEPGWDAVVGIRLERDAYVLRVVDGALVDVHRGLAQAPDAVVSGEVAALHAVTSGLRPLDQALAAGDLAVDGDAAAARRLLASVAKPGAGRPPPEA